MDEYYHHKHHRCISIPRLYQPPIQLKMTKKTRFFLLYSIEERGILPVNAKQSSFQYRQS